MSKGKESCPQEPGIAIGRFIERVIDGRGREGLVLDVRATDEQSKRSLVKDVSRMMGASETIELKSEDDGRQSFGFSSKHWNSSWEPKGPKPNWLPKPKLN